MPATKHDLFVSKKLCPRCKTIKPCYEFSFSKSKRSGLTSYCKECNKLYMRARNRVDNAWHKYGISADVLMAMEREANGVCKICNKKSEKTLHVDHCHTSLRVRGLICGQCNKGLGHFCDNPETMERAARYLRGEL